MVYEKEEYPLVRKAVIDDVQAIHELLNDYAAKGRLLARSLSELYEHLRAYFVLEPAWGDRIQGVCGLGICWKDLAEIESLAVAEAFQGKGFGSNAYGCMPAGSGFSRTRQGVYINLCS